MIKKLHHMVIHFSLNVATQKNYDSALDKYRCLPTNQLEQDQNGTRIVATLKWLKLALRVKKGP